MLSRFPLQSPECVIDDNEMSCLTVELLRSSMMKFKAQYYLMSGSSNLINIIVRHCRPIIHNDKHAFSMGMRSGLYGGRNSVSIPESLNN